LQKKTPHCTSLGNAETEVACNRKCFAPIPTTEEEEPVAATQPKRYYDKKVRCSVGVKIQPFALQVACNRKQQKQAPGFKKHFTRATN
jgi:hypothetical protein